MTDEAEAGMNQRQREINERMQAGGIAQGCADNDPTASKEWNAGCDFALERLAKYVDVDMASIRWDGATETVEGDVDAVIGNILRAKFAEDWGPNGALAERESHSKLADKAGNFREGAKRLYESKGHHGGDMWFFELWHFLGDVQGALNSPAETRRLDDHMTRARRLVENHIEAYGMVPHPDRIKEAIAEQSQDSFDLGFRAAGGSCPSQPETDIDALTGTADDQGLFAVPSTNKDEGLPTHEDVRGILSAAPQDGRLSPSSPDASVPVQPPLE